MTDLFDNSYRLKHKRICAYIASDDYSTEKIASLLMENEIIIIRFYKYIFIDKAVIDCSTIF
jgi:hypothetical protein